MSISDTISQTAAVNPVVGVAVATQSTKSALLAGIEGGDPLTGALVGAASTQAVTDSRLLASLTQVGQNVDTKA